MSTVTLIALEAGLFMSIGASAASSEAATLAYLFALVLFLATLYVAIGAGMTIFSLNTMIARGLRGEKA